MPEPVTIGLMIAGSVLTALTQKTPKPRDSARDVILRDALNRSKAIQKRQTIGRGILRSMTGKTPEQLGIDTKTPTVEDLIQESVADTDPYTLAEDATEALAGNPTLGKEETRPLQGDRNESVMEDMYGGTDGGTKITVETPSVGKVGQQDEEEDEEDEDDKKNSNSSIYGR